MSGVRAYWRVLLASGAALVGLPLAAAGAATEYDGRYAGTIACDAIPGVTSGPLRTEFVVRVADGQARYEREVLRPDGNMPQGITERGTGAVSADGEVTLTGSAGASGWSYQATYRGRIAGRQMRLSGAQEWRFTTRAPLVRPCTITAARAE